MEVFAGPQQTPPRVSLISSAELVPVEDARWEGGFVADLDGYGNPRTTYVCNETALIIEARTGGALSFKPYTLYATAKRNTYGTESDDVEGFFNEAQRKLLAGESSALEAILWDGYAGLLNQNPYLSDGGAGAYTPNATGIASCADTLSTVTIMSAVTSVKDAFAVLENEMGEFSGSRGMIHLRVQAFHALVSAKVVRREGNVWLSPMDNIVVPGRGYPGTGPANQAVGATEWMYGHPGIVQVRRGPIQRLGEDSLAAITHRGWNDQEAIVHRSAHVLLDPYTQVFAIDFDSLGMASSAAAYGSLDVTTGSANVNTTALYGWNFVNGGVAGDVVVNITPGEEFFINLAAGESVTYFFPSPLTVTNVAYTADAGITGTIFIAAAA